MAKRKKPTARSCLATPNGEVIVLSEMLEDGTIVHYDNLTEEETAYWHACQQYKQFQYLEMQAYKEGLCVTTDDPDLLEHPKPVGRFIPR